MGRAFARRAGGRAERKVWFTGEGGSEEGARGVGEAAGDRSRRSGQKGQLVPEEEGRLESID